MHLTTPIQVLRRAKNGHSLDNLGGVNIIRYNGKNIYNQGMPGRKCRNDVGTRDLIHSV